MKESSGLKPQNNANETKEREKKKNSTSSVDQKEMQRKMLREDNGDILTNSKQFYDTSNKSLFSSGGKRGFISFSKL